MDDCAVQCRDSRWRSCVKEQKNVENQLRQIGEVDGAGEVGVAAVVKKRRNALWMDKLPDEATLRLRGGVSVAWGQCEIICQWVVDPLAAEKGAHGLNGRITLNVKKQDGKLMNLKSTIICCNSSWMNSFWCATRTLRIKCCLK